MTAPPPPPQYGQGQQAGPPPNNNLVWAILAILCCWPLAIVAIIKSTQVSNLWAQGQYDAAQKSADDAKKFAVISFAIGGVILLLYIILIIAGVASA